MPTTRRGPNRGHRFTRTGPPAPLEPLLAEWLDQLRTEHKSPRTISVYVSTVARFAKESGVSAASACRGDVIAWFNDHDEWARNTSAQNFSSLSLWFKWLLREGHRTDNPMAKITKVTQLRGEPRPVTNGELVHLLALPRMHQRTRVMILLAALAGLRAGEISRVKGSDVDLSRGVLWVRGKGRGGRPDKTVPLHPLLVTAAQDMPRQEWWFPSAEDPERPMRSESVTAGIGAAMTRAGVSGTPHALRHWYGSTLLANGADLRTVQECMRHASITATQIYTRVPDDRRHEAVATLDPFTSGAAWL